MPALPRGHQPRPGNRPPSLLLPLITIKSALFGVEATVPPLLKPDGSFTHFPKDKSTLFGNMFDSKQSNVKLTMLSSCFPEPKLTTLVLGPGRLEVSCWILMLMVMLVLMAFFHCFYIKTAQYLASNISVLLHKLVRAGSFSIYWSF